MYCACAAPAPCIEDPIPEAASNKVRQRLAGGKEEGTADDKWSDGDDETKNDELIFFENSHRFCREKTIIKKKCNEESNLTVQCAVE
jgi:hypothetical protein